MIRQTSLQAYNNIELSKCQEDVYNAIKTLGLASNLMIKNYLKTEINCVTGRTRELFKQGKVVDSGKKIYRTVKYENGKERIYPSTLWKVV